MISFNKGKIPTLLGIFLLLISLATGIILTNQTRIFTSKASQACQPINIQVTNLTHNSATISFLTDTACQYSLQLDNQIYMSSLGQNPAKIHYFSIKNLKPVTTYSYVLITGGKSLDQPSYTFHTFASPTQGQTDASLSWGRVFQSDAVPATSSIVYLNIPGFHPLSSLVTDQGYWDIPLVNSYSIDSQSWLLPPSDSLDEIVVYSPDGQMIVLVNQSLQKNPVPDIYLDKQQFAQASGVVDFNRPPPNQTSVDFTIQNPAEDETINTSRPSFFGHGPAGLSVEIELNSSTQLKDSLSIDQSGSWQWESPQDLEPGDHTIKLKYTDPVSQTVKTITRKFTVLATYQDNPLAFTASASATPRQTVSPTHTPIPTLSLQPTQTPIPTLIPTATNLSTSPPITPTLAVTGGLATTISLIALALILSFGAIIFLSY